MGHLSDIANHLKPLHIHLVLQNWIYFETPGQLPLKTAFIPQWTLAKKVRFATLVTIQIYYGRSPVLHSPANKESAYPLIF